MRIPDPKANTTTEAYLAYKAGYLEESELKPVLYEPYLHFDAWLAYWAGLTYGYPLKEVGKNLFSSPIVIGGWAANGAEINSNKRFKSKNKMSVSSGSSYIISGSPKDDTKTLNITVQAYASDGSIIRQFPSSSTWGDVPLSFTAPDGCAYITISGRYSDDTVLGVLGQETDVFQNAQLEVGSAATVYEPYAGEPEMLTDEEALVAYLSGVTDTYPEEIKDPYDVRIVGYLKHLVSIRWPEPDYPVNNEEFYLSTMEPTHTSNPEPSSDIELDTAEGKIIGVEAYGDTYQQTYSGKNLLELFGKTTSGVTGTVNADGSYTISGTGTVTDGVSVFVFNGVLPAGTYTLSLSRALPKVINLSLESGVALRISAGSTSATLTTTKEYTSAIVFFGIVNGESYDETFNMQLVAGETPDYDFEPYVGGIPSPNPDYPQDIQVVTGEQTVTVTGKNLYNLTSGPTTESGVTGIGTTEYFTMDGVVSGIGGRLVFNECTLPAGTYTATTYCDSGEIVSNVNFCVYKKNTWTQVTPFTAMKFFPSEIGTSKTATFTLSEETSLWFSAYLNTGASFENLKGRFQLEKGSTATDYEPYQGQSYTIDLGDIELCKIGDYQDKIFNNDPNEDWYDPNLEDNAWYVHKEVSKQVLDGTENIYNKDINSGFTRIYFPLTGQVNVGNARNTDLRSDYFNASHVNNYGTAFLNNARAYVYPQSTITTVEEFKTWLSSNNTTFYYPLATATDTQITDETLVGQLDALAEADTYNGKTLIEVTATDPNLPALLKVEAYKY